MWILIDHTLILFRADSVSRHIVDERFAELGLAPRAVMEMSSPEAMRKLVEAGVGVSFLPRSTVEESLAAGALKSIKVRGIDFSRQTGLAWRRGRYFGAAIRHLLDGIFAAYGKEAEWRDRIQG